jgi:four helix bundle protein
MTRGVKRFWELRAWQTCDVYKKAVYRLCLDPPIARDWKRRDQLEESVAGPPGHIAEGFGRFNPPDFARYCVMARASLMESQNHLMDAVDKRYITEDTRLQLNQLAEEALEEVTGLMEYLQSPEALRNARRARERRIASRPERLHNRPPRKRRANSEPATSNTEPETSNAEPTTSNAEPTTSNAEPTTSNAEPSTPNPERRTSKFEHSTEPEHEPRTENPEA